MILPPVLIATVTGADIGVCAGPARLVHTSGVAAAVVASNSMFFIKKYSFKTKSNLLVASSLDLLIYFHPFSIEI